jgi:hypothetical protein
MWQEYKRRENNKKHLRELPTRGALLSLRCEKRRTIERIKIKNMNKGREKQ